MVNKISLVKTQDHTTGVNASLNLITPEIRKALEKISKIVIKLNFVTTRIEIATTPFQAVKSFIDFILPFFKGEIVIAEEASIGDTKEGFKKYGFTDLAKEISQVTLLDLEDDEILTKSITYPEGEITLPICKSIVEAPFLVSIVRPKTHDAVVVTLGIKNVLIGAIQGGIPIRKQIHRGKYTHNIMTSIAEFVYPEFVLIDGETGMEGDGPVSGSAIRAGWVLASLDALAADSLAAYLMGFDIKDIGYLNMLKDKNFGLLYPEDEIEILGESPEDLITPFKPHRTVEEQKKWR